MHTPIDNLKMTWAWDGSGGSITQYFGNKAAIYTKLGLEGHNGIDIVDKWRTPLRAVCKGIVKEVRRDASGYGRHIRLLDDTKDTSGWQENWVYGHCEDIFVDAGDLVEAGQIIGTMGNTGFVVSSNPDGSHPGTHLHLGVRKEKYVDGIRTGVKDYSNGYKGRYDFKARLETAVQTPTKRRMMFSILSIGGYVVRQLQLVLAKKQLKELLNNN